MSRVADDRCPPALRRSGLDMHTVLCAFDDRTTGLRAMTRLIAAGVARDDVHLQPPPEFYLPVDDEGPDRVAPASWRSRVASLCRWLVSPAVPGEAGTYRDAIRRGSTVIVVHLADGRAAARTCELMSAFGAFDVERRTSCEVRRSGSRAPARRSRHRRQGAPQGRS